MARNRTVRSPRHWCALCLCVMTILVQCQMPSANDDVQHPGRVKRQSATDPVTGFLEAVKTRPVDLIILMERSKFIAPRQWFYLRARKLVSYVLRYYVKMGPFDVKLVLATFATDITVHINGMQNSILKCQIWDQYWDDVVLVDTPELLWNMAHVKRAYERAQDIFIKYGSPNREKFIWLLTSGNYRMDGIYDPRPIATNLKNMGVTIVATKVGGNEGHNKNIEEIVTSDQHHGGEVEDWITTLDKMAEIEDDPDLMLTSPSTLCYCEQSFGFTICGGCGGQSCAHGATCTSDCVCTNFTPHFLCPKLDTRRVCPIYSGKTGRYCDVTVKECVRGTCANNGTCHEPQRAGDFYTCTCPPPYLPELFCEGARSPPPAPNPTIGNGSAASTSGNSSIGPAVGAAVASLIIILVVVGFCIWRKKRRPDTRNAATSTNQRRPSTISSLNFLNMFRRKGAMDTSSKLSIGSYLEIQSLPPALPNTLPPPTTRYMKSKPRKSLRGLLQYLPEHLHPSTQQEEVEKAVSVINVGHQGAAADGADGEDNKDYENVGSKNMPGWENYVMKLATEGGLRNFAIVKYDRDAYVTTCEIWLLPTADELSHIYNIMLSRHTGDFVNLKSARYKVTKNNGKMLESWLEGRTPDVLCIGRSKQYLVLGVETDRANTGNCYQEVSWVRENLSRQGK